MVLAALQIVAEEQIEYLRGRLRVLGHDLDETARFGVHGRQPHHLRVVLAEALGAVDLIALALKRFHDVVLLLVGVGEPRLVAAVDLKERRFRDVDVPLADERGAETVDHRQDQRADLEAVHVRIGADDDLAPA